MTETDGPRSSSARRGARRHKARYRRARLRNFVFTVGPGRLTGGRIARRHLARSIVLRTLETGSPRWPESFDGLRIGHLSDFHLGDLVPLERLLEAIDLLARQEPVLLACTGDLVDLHHEGAPPLFEALAAIRAPMGTAVVPGNHDELHCPHTIMAMARRAGLLVLHDEAARIRRNGTALTVAGVSWASTSRACGRRVEGACDEATDLLLAHNPRTFARAAEIGVPLTLAGHTHGGQVALKNRPNANLALAHRHGAGLFESGSSRLFVTTGVGSWFPLRLNCPAEVAVITMRHIPARRTEP